MPSLSLTKRKKKKDEAAEPTSMATGGRYRKLPEHQLADPHPTSTIVRHSTTIRKSEQAKNTRSLSVPSLNSVDTSLHPISPSRKPRSNSVRATGSSKGSSKSLKNRLAKILGSHSDLTDKGNATSEQQGGVYRPLGPGRPRSIGGSSDCSSSSLTSGPHHSDFSRHNSLRASKVSQNSVFSSRQASYDSAETLSHNFPMGPLGPTSHLSPVESGHRPKSIACMQRSGSNSSLKNSVLHSVNDPRYHSIAALPPRMVEIPDLFSPAEERAQHRHIRGGLHRGPTLPDEPESPLEASAAVVPSDPHYRKVAENLMTRSPQPRSVEEYRPLHQLPSDVYGEPSKKSPDDLAEDISSVSRTMAPPTSSPGMHSLIRGQDTRQVHSPKHMSPSASSSISSTANPLLPPGWELVVNHYGTPYYVDHNTHTTHWKLPDAAALNLPPGWEVVHSSQYGTYFVNHNNRTAQYTNPIHSRRPPPSYHEAIQNAEEDTGRRAPTRSHSHRSSQAHRIIDPYSSLPRRSKSFKDPAMATASHDVIDTETVHTRQLSTMTYVPPSPFQIAEIPSWLKDYVDAPFGSDKDNLQWQRYPVEDLNGLDTMIKRLFRKGSEQVVKNCEYYRVALQQELDLRHRQAKMQEQLQTKREQAGLPQYTPPSLPPPSAPSPNYPIVPNLRPRNGLVPAPPTQPKHLPTHSMPTATNPNYPDRPNISQQHHQGTQTQDDLFNGLEETFV